MRKTERERKRMQLDDFKQLETIAEEHGWCGLGLYYQGKWRKLEEELKG